MVAVLLVAVVGVVVCVLMAPRVHPFLAVTKTVDADVLVVEGWVHEYMIAEAADIFWRQGYSLVVVTGLSAGESATMVAAQRLTAAGVPAAAVIQVPAAAVRVHKTAAAAQALEHWLAGYPQYRSVDVFSAGPHARKTYVTFRKVLGPRIEVGIIAARVEHYDVDHWWRSRRSIYIVVKSYFGYLYAAVWPFW